MRRYVPAQKGPDQLNATNHNFAPCILRSLLHADASKKLATSNTSMPGRINTVNHYKQVSIII